MAGMPDPVETSDDNGGAANYFKFIEDWLNDPNLETRKNNRAQAKSRVAGNLAGVTAPTLSGTKSNDGMNHFNRHWRGGSSGWWPNITKARVDSELSKAFDAALRPANNNLKIRIRWDCTNTNVNDRNSAFSASVRNQGGAVWIDITSPRAP